MPQGGRTAEIPMEKRISKIGKVLAIVVTISFIGILLFLGTVCAQGGEEGIPKEDWKFSGHSDSIYAVAVDNNGYVYSGGGYDDRTVKKISPNGNKVWTLSHSDPVSDVAVDGNGYVYTASGHFEKGVVKKINPNGNEVWTFSDHSDLVNTVAVDGNGYVYSGSNDDTVKKINPNGNEVWTFPDHSSNVMSLAVDSNGYVYSGSHDETVRKIDPNGNEVWTFNQGSPVYGVTVDSDGYVYSVDIDERVKKIKPNGNEVWTFTASSKLIEGRWDIAVDEDGYVYFTSNDTVMDISPDGSEVDSFTVNDDRALGIGLSPNSEYLGVGTGWSNHLVYRFTFTKYQNTAPDQPTDPSPSDGSKVTSTSPTISVDVSDSDGDSMDVTFYDASDGSKVGASTGVSDGGTASTTWSGLSSGNSYDWYAIADDGTTSTRSNTWSFTVDSQPPSSSISPDGVNWQNSDRSYSISCSDSTSECSKTYWEKINKGGSCPSKGNFANSGSPTISDSVTCSDGDICEIDVCYYSEDTLKNTESIVTSNTFQIDKKDPTTSIGSPSAGTWQNSDFSISIDESDSGSGLSSCEYRVDDDNDGSFGSWNSRSCDSSFKVTIGSSAECSTQGRNECKVQIKVTDAAGNIKTDSRAFSVDYSNPNSGVDSLLSYQDSNSWSISWSGSDTHSEVKHYDIQYSKNDGAWNDCVVNNNSTSLTFPDDCTASSPSVSSGDKFEFRSSSQDIALNQESYPSSPETTTTVDTTLPSSSIDPDGVSWQKSDQRYNISCSDSISGCDTVYWEEIDGGNSCPSQGLFAKSGSPPVSDTVSCPDGDTCLMDVCYYSKDMAGNIGSTIKSSTFKVDKSESLSSISSPSEGSWQNSNFLVSTIDSNLSSCEYRIDDNNDGNWSSWKPRACDSSFTVSVGENGACSTEGSDGCTVQIKAVDSTGNSIKDSNTYSIDYTEPDSGLDSLPSYQNSTSWKVSWSGSDIYSGVGHYDIQYSRNNGSWRDCVVNNDSNSINFPEDCTASSPSVSSRDKFKFRSRSKDVAGNQEEFPISAEASITIDTEPPSYSHVQDDLEGVVGEERAINISVYWNDSISRLNKAEFYHNASGSMTLASDCDFASGSGWCNRTIDTAGDGGKAIYWKIAARDNAGNLESIGSSFKVVSIKAVNINNQYKIIQPGGDFDVERFKSKCSGDAPQVFYFTEDGQLRTAEDDLNNQGEIPYDTFKTGGGLILKAGREVCKGIRYRDSKPHLSYELRWNIVETHGKIFNIDSLDKSCGSNSRIFYFDEGTLKSKDQGTKSSGGMIVKAENPPCKGELI